MKVVLELVSIDKNTLKMSDIIRSLEDCLDEDWFLSFASWNGSMVTVRS
jgi:hypothetical protein